MAVAKIQFISLGLAPVQRYETVSDILKYPDEALLANFTWQLSEETLLRHRRLRTRVIREW